MSREAKRGKEGWLLVFYMNRAGKNLSPARRRELEKAKGELRRLFGRGPSR